MKKRRKVLLIVGGIVIVVGLLVTAVVFTRNQIVHRQTVEGGKQPNFQTLAPPAASDKPPKDATVRDTPNDGQVYSFIDTIDGVAITVNQQKLPANTTVEDIAKNLNANSKLTAGSTTVYIGTSEQGPQTAVLGKKNLLILIKSEKPVKDSSWIRYASSLN